MRQRRSCIWCVLTRFEPSFPCLSLKDLFWRGSIFTGLVQAMELLSGGELFDRIVNLGKWGKHRSHIRYLSQL